MCYFGLAYLENMLFRKREIANMLNLTKKARFPK